MTFEKTVGWCVYGSGTLLALSTLFKLISAYGSVRILSQPDPVFGINNQSVFLLAGLLEIAVVAMLLRSDNLPFKLFLLAALATNFLLYHAGLWWLGVHAPCPCLGNAAAWTHLPLKTLDLAMKWGLVWLLATSYGPLLMLYFRVKSPTVANLAAV